MRKGMHCTAAREPITPHISIGRHKEACKEPLTSITCTNRGILSKWKVTSMSKKPSRGKLLQCMVTNDTIKTNTHKYPYYHNILYPCYLNRTFNILKERKEKKREK